MRVRDLVEELRKLRQDDEVHVDVPECEDGPLVPEPLLSVQASPMLWMEDTVHLELSPFPKEEEGPGTKAVPDDLAGDVLRWLVLHLLTDSQLDMKPPMLEHTLRHVKVRKETDE